MKLSNSENDISFDIDTNKENNTNADTQDLLCAHPGLPRSAFFLSATPHKTSDY